MDAKELARQKAEQLHIEAVSNGDNPWDILDLVKSEVDRQEIDCYGLKSGDPQLKGARASYNSQTGIILYEDSVSEFEQAFLIAHELAHIMLEGNQQDSETFDIHPECTIENAQVGVDRVIDYGSLEQREVRMDIFAKEFLLPRYKLRNWHINEDLSSTAIAKTIKAPVEIVQQQLIDALLLPEVKSFKEQKETIDFDLDVSQRIAVEHEGSPFQLQAGPGTGKTFTLVKKIKYLLAGGVDPQSILVLTFSNKAAGELIKRIAESHPQEAAAMWIGTFHSFGLDIVRRFYEYLDRPKEPQLIDKVEAIDLLEDDFARLPLKHYRNLYDATLIISEMLNAISRAKDEVSDAKHYRYLSEKMLKKAGSDEKLQERAEKSLEVSILYELYEKILKNKNRIDFGDLISLPVTLLESNEKVRATISQRHKYILVDEYQDVNRASIRLLKSIAGTGENLWVVGDSRQSIYRFRGASSQNMSRFNTDFPNAKIKQLDTNYRSSEEIIDTYKTFSETMVASQKALSLNLNSARGSSSSIPELLVTNTPEDEITHLSEVIKQNNSTGITYGEQAVLSASNDRLSQIALGLEAHGVPILHLGNLFERREIKYLLSILSLLIDGQASGITNITANTNFSIDLQCVHNTLSFLKEKNSKPLEWTNSINDIENISDDAKDTLNHLSLLFQDCKIYDQPWSVLSSIVIDQLHIGKDIYQSESIQKQLEGIAIWQLLNLCRRQIIGKEKTPIQRLLGYIRRLVLLNDDRDLRQLPRAAQSLDAVKLMTIHGSKGLEFDAVHIPSLVSTALPRPKRPPRCLPPDGLIDGMVDIPGHEAVVYGHDEEEECIFFVALSRAKDKLFLYTFSKMNGRNRSRSKFLDRIHPNMRKSKTESNVKGCINHPLIINWQNNFSFTDKQIGLYQKCPRRFFYTYILNSGGKRKENTFMQLHSAVQETIDWLKSVQDIEEINKSSLEKRFEEIWRRLGPVNHGYEDDYKNIGLGLINYYLKSREGRKTTDKVEELSLTLPEGIIKIIPDEVLIDPKDQSLVIRCIKTGKKRLAEFDDIEYSILQAALEQSYGGKAKIEAVHLSGETCETFDITTRKSKARISNTQDSFTKINNGSFPQNRTRSCPNCPHFFVCGDIPKGKLKK